MQLAENLFVADNVTDLETVVYSLKQNIPMPRLYCILFISEKKRYEMASSWELCRGRFQSKDGVIVGVANGKRKGMDLIAYLIEEVVKDGKDLSKPDTWIEGIGNELRL